MKIVEKDLKMDHKKKDQKEDKSSAKNQDGYVLIIVDDPYGGVDYWFNNDLEELVDQARDEWEDWIGVSETSLVRFRYGQMADHIEGILPPDEGEKFGDVDSELYPPIETNDDHTSVYCCFYCQTFEHKSKKCSHCQEKLF